MTIRSQDSSVWNERPEFESWRGNSFFSIPRRPDRGDFSPGGKADHSLPSSAEIKNVGTIPPLPHISSWRGSQLSTVTNLPFFHLI
jgi:hypothetical protein